MNKYTDEQIEHMKARLLSNMTTIVTATVNTTEENPIPEVKVHDNIAKELCARMQLVRDTNTIVIVYDLGFDPDDEAIEEAVFKAKEEIYRKMEEYGI